jgi:hypothetical protein
MDTCCCALRRADDVGKIEFRDLATRIDAPWPLPLIREREPSRLRAQG